MKTISAFFVCILLTTAAFACCGQEDPIESEADATISEKIYIEPENLQFDKKDIFVFHHDTWHRVRALFSDEMGLYVSRQPSTNTWRCVDCTRYHNCDQSCPETGLSPPLNCRK